MHGHSALSFLFTFFFLSFFFLFFIFKSSSFNKNMLICHVCIEVLQTDDQCNKQNSAKNHTENCHLYSRKKSMQVFVMLFLYSTVHNSSVRPSVRPSVFLSFILKYSTLYSVPKRNITCYCNFISVQFFPSPASSFFSFFLSQLFNLVFSAINGFANQNQLNSFKETNQRSDKEKTVYTISTTIFNCE